MTREGIKAVRFCCGYNTDLRQKLDWKVKGNEIILDFIEKQAFEVCTGQPSENNN